MAEVNAAFQMHLDAINKKLPADYDSPHFLAIMRHTCSGQGSRSKALDLEERRITFDDIANDHDSEDIAKLAEYAMLYREGLCRRCKQTARSSVGRLIKSEDRPPISGRVGRV